MFVVPLAAGILCSASAVPRIVSPEPLAQVLCGNCTGTADADFPIGTGACPGEFVSIDVTVDSKDCVTVYAPGGGLTCKKVDCRATVSRQWSWLPPNSTMTWCTVYSYVPLVYNCLRMNEQLPNAGPTGTGTAGNFLEVHRGSGTDITIKSQCGTGAVATVECKDKCGP